MIRLARLFAHRVLLWNARRHAAAQRQQVIQCEADVHAQRAELAKCEARAELYAREVRALRLDIRAAQLFRRTRGNP